MLLTLVLTLLSPDPMRLGADDWAEREAATALYSNPLSALMLPDTHEDAEIAHRLKAIKAIALREIDPRYIERVLHRDHYSDWLQRHVIDGDTMAFTLTEVWYELHTDTEKANQFFKLAPLTDGYRNDGWLRGGFVPGEYEVWRNHVLWHRWRNVTGPALSILNGAK